MLRNCHQRWLWLCFWTLSLFFVMREGQEKFFMELLKGAAISAASCHGWQPAPVQERGCTEWFHWFVSWDRSHGPFGGIITEHFRSMYQWHSLKVLFLLLKLFCTSSFLGWCTSHETHKQYIVLSVCLQVALYYPWAHTFFGMFACYSMAVDIIRL